jgi:hypothetical protein
MKESGDRIGAGRAAISVSNGAVGGKIHAVQHLKFELPVEIAT